MNIYVTKNSIFEYCKIDDEFHDLILSICENRRILQIREYLGSIIYRYQIRSLNDPGRLNKSLEKH